jgi:hypothetical protein
MLCGGNFTEEMPGHLKFCSSPIRLATGFSESSGWVAIARKSPVLTLKSEPAKMQANSISGSFSARGDKCA